MSWRFSADQHQRSSRGLPNSQAIDVPLGALTDGRKRAWGQAGSRWSQLWSLVLKVPAPWAARARATPATGKSAPRAAQSVGSSHAKAPTNPATTSVPRSPIVNLSMSAGGSSRCRNAVTRRRMRLYTRIMPRGLGLRLEHRGVAGVDRPSTATPDIHLASPTHHPTCGDGFRLDERVHRVGMFPDLARS